jgi:hypothetical protein
VPKLSKPPAVALAILNFFSSQPDFPAMMGDISEEFQERVAASGAGAASRWFWKDTFRNTSALTRRELMRTPIRTITIALGSVVAVNAVTAMYVLYAKPDLDARQWWTLLLLQFAAPLILGWIGAGLVPGREWALVLTYTAASACSVGAVIVVVRLWNSPVCSIHLSEPLRPLAIWGNGFRQGAFWLSCLAVRPPRGGHRKARNVMKQILGICILMLVSGSALGQTVAVPARGNGTWELNTQKSIFGPFLMPGLPADFKIISQTLRIEQTDSEIRISGDTVYSDSSGTHSTHDDNRLSLDGKATIVGPISLSFRRIGDSAFDIVSKVSVRGRNLGEVSHFSFSPDGKTLTETKKQTEREVVQAGANQGTDKVTKTSTSVLVFTKIPKR